MQPRSLPDFEFRPLQHETLPTPTSIRLIFPRVGKRGSSSPSLYGKPLIECLLKTVDLADVPAPEYIALSWSWNNPFGKQRDSFEDAYSSKHLWPIAVNGRLVFIRRNLYEALERLSDLPWNAQLTAAHPLEDEARFKPHNQTKLIEDAGQGQLQRVTGSLEQGASVKSRDIFGQTALHHAAGNGYVHVVKILLRYGADAATRDNAGRTPLDCCLQSARGQHEAVARVLNSFSDVGYWIDALSINQDDILERNAQVVLMSRIYQSAANVYIWLGAADKHTPRISDCGSKRLKMSVLQFRSLFCRSWFSRKWIIQELCLAKEPIMFCGEYCFNPLQFFKAIRPENRLCTLARCADPGAPLVKQGYGARGNQFWDLICLYRWTSQKQERADSDYLGLAPPSLLSLIVITWHFKSVDPRDRIFALLGLADFTGPNACQTMVADYNRSVAEVFADMGWLFLRAPGRNEFKDMDGNVETLQPLEALSFVQHPLRKAADGTLTANASKRIKGTPSWLPNFHLDLTTTRLHHSRFSADEVRGAPKELKIAKTHGQIRLDGHPFDTVAEVESKTAAQEIGTGDFTPNIAAWFRMTLALDNPYPEPASASRVEALWRTLTADEIWDEGPAAAKGSFKEFLCEYMQDGSRVMKKDPLLHGLMYSLRVDDDSDSLPSRREICEFPESRHCPAENGKTSRQLYRAIADRNFHSAFHKFSKARALFRTKGGFLGLGPLSAQVGDQVWLLKGARTPFILRPVGECFQLVGECYVHGIMYGGHPDAEPVAFEPIRII